MKAFSAWAAWGFFLVAAFGNYAARDFAGMLECAGLALLAHCLIPKCE